MRNVIWIIIFTPFIMSCGPREKSVAYVTETRVRATRHNLEIKVHYVYEYDKTEYQGQYIKHQLPIVEKGDSILIEIKVKNPKKSKVLLEYKQRPEGPFNPHTSGKEFWETHSRDSLLMNSNIQY